MPLKTKANLILVNIPSSDVEKTRAFYGQLLGIDLVESLNEDTDSYHAPISEDGIDINVNERRVDEETVMAYFSVANLDQTLQEVQKAGGRVLWGPEKLEIDPEIRDDYKKGVKAEWPELKVSDDVGRAAVVLDPGGSQVGLVQLAEHTHGHYNEGKYRKPLSERQERVHKRSRELGKKWQQKRRNGR